jgi:hypothetical protein
MKNLLLDSLQVCRSDTKDTTEEFQRTFSVGALLLLKTDIVITADDRRGEHI